MKISKGYFNIDAIWSIRPVYSVKYYDIISNSYKYKIMELNSLPITEHYNISLIKDDLLRFRNEHGVGELILYINNVEFIYIGKNFIDTIKTMSDDLKLLIEDYNE